MILPKMRKIFLRRSNQKDEEGNRLMANTDANGRFHSDWLFHDVSPAEAGEKSFAG